MPALTSLAEMHTGDTMPDLTGTLTSDGVPLDLSSAASVAVNVSLRGAPAVIARPAQVVEPAAGTIRMQWQPGDLSRPGTALVTAVVTWAPGRTQTIGPAQFEVL